MVDHRQSKTQSNKSLGTMNLRYSSFMCVQSEALEIRAHNHTSIGLENFTSFEKAYTNRKGSTFLIELVICHVFIFY